MDLIKRRKDAEASSLSRTGSAILEGLPINVSWLPEESGELGYTNESRTVFIAWKHKGIMGMLSDTECTAFRMGVFAHELLHQCLTNFVYTKIICQKMSQAEAAVFMQFANTLEDPAIEHFAPQVFGGKLLDALRFSIRHIYMVSPKIDGSPNAFSQLINALINFGDMGLVKGNFTYPKAYEYFCKVAPLYNEGITCPDSKKRLDIAYQCMQICKPLWEEAVKEEEFLEELIKELLKELKKNGLLLFDGKLKEMNDESDAGERRKAAVAQMKAAEKSKKTDEGDPSGESCDAAKEKCGNEDLDNGKEDANPDETASEPIDLDDLDDLDDSDEQNEENGSASNAGEENSEDTENKGGSGCDSESVEDLDEDAESDSGNSSGADGGMDSDASTENKCSSSGVGGSGSEEKESDSDNEESGSNLNELLTADEETANEIAKETYEITEDMLEKIENSVQEEERTAEKETIEKNTPQQSLPSFDVNSEYYKSAFCLNRRMVSSSPEATSVLYNTLKTEFAYEIKHLKKTLNKIFENDVDENYRFTSGSYNIKRGTIATSARIFDKRREHGDKKDVCVMLVVDESGSMGGQNKMFNARKTAIVFAEALSDLHVPYYVMGFKADMGADAVHDHYVDWSNKKRDRESLAGMSSGGNNFDGYSIRYAAKLLETRPENNKIMFVISDGQPAARKYHGGNAGIADTINAIKDARKVGTVFGIGLGTSCGPEILQQMYGKDFIFCEDPALLNNTLCKKLEKLIARD